MTDKTPPMSKPDARVVGWVSQVIRDGSIGGRIVPANWTTTDEQLAALNHEPWVVVGKAAVIGLVPESLLAEAESRVVVLDRLHDEAAIQRDTFQMRLADMQAKLDAVGRLPDEWLAAVRKNGVYDEFDSGLNAARTSDANELRAALGGESPANDEERK